MDPFKKSLLFRGLLLPIFLTLLICVGGQIIQKEIHREFLQKKLIFDEMKKHEALLNLTVKKREIMKEELPRIRSYFNPSEMSQATASIASQCSDEKGLKLGDLKQNGENNSAKSFSHQLKLLGRSAPLLEILGETQISHPAIHLDQWSIGLQLDQHLLLFHGTLQLVTLP